MEFLDYINVLMFLVLFTERIYGYGFKYILLFDRCNFIVEMKMLGLYSYSNC